MKAECESVSRRLLGRAVAGLGLASVFGAAVASPGASGLPGNLARSARQTSRAARSILNCVTKAGMRLVAVGERGIVIVSDDGGLHWRQVPIPVSVTLTAVTFADERNGCIAGHGGVLLHSSDAGGTWSLRCDGATYGLAALAAAKESTELTAVARQAALRDAQRLIAEGADKPFLALCFADAKHGLAVGAYGIAASTHDGGRHWQPCAHLLPNPQGMHLYAVACAQGRWVIGGEQGLVLSSNDDGRSFFAVDGVQKRSFFTATATREGRFVLGGLLGNACVVDVTTGAVTESQLPGPHTVLSSMLRRDGSLLLTEQGGRLLRSDDGGLSFAALPGPRLPLTSLVEASDGGFAATSFAGVIRLSKDLAVNKAHP